jgi:hypothetical protein
MSAVGNVVIQVDGTTYKTVTLFAGVANVQLSKTLAVGSHAVVAQYQGSSMSLPATSATATLTVSKAATTISLSKASAPTFAAKSTVSDKKLSSLHVKKSKVHAIQIKVHIVGSSRAAKGKVVITVNGKKVKTVSLTASRAGKLIVTLPKFKKTTGKVTVRAQFMGSKSLKGVKSKKLVIHLP